MAHENQIKCPRCGCSVPDVPEDAGESETLCNHCFTRYENEAIVEEWKARGFTEETVFPGEYVLLLNPRTIDVVRIYESGDVWVKNPTTGEYERQP